MSEPKIPDELWAVHGPEGYEGDGVWCECCPDGGRAKALAEMTGCKPVLVGVSPARLAEAEAGREMLIKALAALDDQCDRVLADPASPKSMLGPARVMRETLDLLHEIVSAAGGGGAK